MTAPVDPRATVLACAITGGALLALWWLLRRESRGTLLALAALTAAALALRLLHLDDYPQGLNEDEPKVLGAAIAALHGGRLLAESNISVPVLMHALFQATLVPLLGIGWWTIRLYSLVGGALCVPAAFATARAMRLSALASLAGAAFIAVLPWALFYSRVMQGAELSFQQLLLLAALAALIWRDGSWREALIGAFALGWMLYGYWCTRAMLPMPLLAALLATGWRRLWCVAVLGLGVLPYLPYPRANPTSVYAGQGLQAQLLTQADPGVVWTRTVETLHAFVAPVAQNGWLTVCAGAQHPVLLLVLAVAGALSGWRRAAFLLGGFAFGLVPTVLAWGQPSTHRMMMAFPFVALAAAAACDDLVPRRRWRAAAVAAVVAATAVWSVRLYFSDQFWMTETRWLFDPERTDLVASLPLDAGGRPVILLRQVTQFQEPRRLLAADDRTLTVELWPPPASGALYAFTREAVLLRPLLAGLFGADRVRAFGRTFTVDVPPGDWSGLRAHGWTYCARCGDDTRRAIVPTLHQLGIGFTELHCWAPSRHEWAARWEGAATRLRVDGAERTVAVETPRERREGPYALIDVRPGDVVRVITDGPPGVPLAYTFATVDGQLPAWDAVTPVECTL